MEDACRAYYCRKYAGCLLPSLAKAMKSASASGFSVGQRDQVIRLVADGSLAVTAARGSSSCCWSRALARQVVASTDKVSGSNKTSRRMLSRRRRAISMRRRKVLPVYQSSSSRMEVLKDLVPGGKLVKSSELLLQEAVDYMMFLEIQVGVLRSLAAGHGLIDI